MALEIFAFNGTSMYIFTVTYNVITYIYLIDICMETQADKCLKKD